uniref:(California timema) hypothetical protein n=1 Tax=Timema californicum TaxID=61474 RepID=A0A7R9PDA0_TIMCA|nr:unnamed protein product [Timema californicum]
MSDNIIVEKLGPITTIGINRPNKRNCVNKHTAEQLSKAIRDFEDDKSVYAGVLHGKGGNFCTGVDLEELAEQDEKFNLEFNIKEGEGLMGLKSFINDSSLAKWILAIPQSVPICSALNNFCGTRNIAYKQNVELRSSWHSKNDRDRQTFYSSFDVYRPFAYCSSTEFISLSTGLAGDKFVNCVKALEIGSEFMKNMNAGTFEATKLKRMDRTFICHD